MAAKSDYNGITASCDLCTKPSPVEAYVAYTIEEFLDELESHEGWTYAKTEEGRINVFCPNCSA